MKKNLIPEDSIMRDERSNELSYFSLCIGVRKGETIYCPPHLYVSDKLHIVDSHTVCDQCMDLRKELKKYKVI